MNTTTMDEAFRRFEWHVASEYIWQDWLDERRKPVLIPDRDLMGLGSRSAVERTWVALQEKKQKTGPVLSPGLDPLWRRYSPMSRDHATLFRTFAEIDYQDRIAIAGFAAEYGLLGLPPQEQTLSIPERPAEERLHHVRGESHLDWAREICLMREALHLARSRTPAEEQQDRAAWNRVGREPPHDERRRKLDWLFNVHLQHVQPRMSFEADAAPRLSFAPLTLLAAMWLQLALSVVGDKEFRACKFCHRLFEISTEQTGYRKHREFCSESCKTKDYRKRKSTAMKLAVEGKSAANIAKQIATSGATVRTWIASSRRRAKEK